MWGSPRISDQPPARRLCRLAAGSQAGVAVNETAQTLDATGPATSRPIERRWPWLGRASREAKPADPPDMPESLVRRILWSGRARTLASASWRVAHLIGVAASPLVVFSLTR